MHGVLEIWWWKEFGAGERLVSVAIPHGEESCGEEGRCEHSCATCHLMSRGKVFACFD